MSWYYFFHASQGSAMMAQPAAAIEMAGAATAERVTRCNNPTGLRKECQEKGMPRFEGRLDDSLDNVGG